MDNKLINRLDNYKNSMMIVNWNNYDSNNMPKYFKEGVIPEDVSFKIMSCFYSYVINNIHNKNDITEEHYRIVESYKKYRSLITDKSIKKDLKKVINEIERYLNLIINEQLDDSRFFDILKYFINQEDGIIYINELLKRNKDIANSKKNGVHILVYAYDVYLNNYYKMCKNKNSDYLGKDNLAQIIQSLVRNSKKLDMDDYEKINNLYYNHLNNISFLKKKKRREAAKKDAKYISDIILKKKTLYEEAKENLIDDGLMTYYIDNSVNTYLDGIKYSKNANVYEDAFTYNDNGFAYTVYKTASGYQVKLHVIKIDDYITYDSIIHNYIKNNLLQKQSPDTFSYNNPMHKVFRRKLGLKQNQVYSTLAFVFDFNNKGMVTNFDVKKGRIKVSSSEYLRQSDEYLNERINVNPEVDALRDIYLMNLQRGTVPPVTCESRNRINEFFSSLLSSHMASYMNENKLPCILFGNDAKLKEKTSKHEDALTNILSRLEKEDFNVVKNVFGSKINDLHYSYIYDPDFEYKIDLLDPLSLLGFEIKKMLARLVFNDNNLSEEKLKKMYNYYRDYFIMLSKELNANMHAVDLADMEYFKGKLNNKSVEKNGNIKNLK